MINLYADIKLWIQQALCDHDWEYFQIHKGYYDEECGFVCKKCGKEEDK